MAIDHEAHKIRIKAVSDRMNHPMTYNDAGAPREMPAKNQEMRREKMSLGSRAERDLITGGR